MRTLADSERLRHQYFIDIQSSIERGSRELQRYLQDSVGNFLAISIQSLQHSTKLQIETISCSNATQFQSKISTWHVT